MKIDSHTPQAALGQLYCAVTRREMLRSTPLNVRLLLRYALLFILFPGMAAGFWVGLGATLAFCAVLMGLLAANEVACAAKAAQIWLVGGLCVFVWVSSGAVRAALRLRRIRETPRPSEAPQASTPAAPECGVERKLRWHKSEDGSGWVAEVHWQVQQGGIYAALLRVQAMGRSRLLTLGRQGACTVYTSEQGDALQSLLLYKLEAGAHTLRWAVQPRMAAPPHASVTLLCSPHEGG